MKNVKNKLPLNGIRILEFTQWLPGPLCAQMLADLGSDVIKIETPEGDRFRSMPPLIGKTGSVFQVLNRNKRGLCLNLRKKESIEIIYKLVETADVLLESFRPGFMEKIDLGYERLKTINPRLIYCSLTGFGQEGPYKDYGAHEINFEAISGILNQLGNREKPPVPLIQIAGVGGGSLTAVIGIMAGLFHRAQCGKGQYLDISIINGLAPFLAVSMARYFGSSKPQDAQLYNIAPYNVYKTKDGRYLAVGSREQRSWNEFCKAIGRDDLKNDLNSCPEKQSKMVKILKQIFRKKNLSEWLSIFQEYDACVSPVNDLGQATADQQILQSKLWFTKNHSIDGEIFQQNFPIKLWADHNGWRLEPPKLGEHTIEILRDLGYSEKQIRKFRETSIILN